MNRQNKTIAIVVGVIVLLAIIVAVAAKPKNRANEQGIGTENSVPSSEVSAENTNNTSESASSNTSGTKNTTSTSKVSSSSGTLPAGTLVVLTPGSGGIFQTGSTLHISWDSSVNLTDAQVVITLMKNGKEIVTITEKGGARADTKGFNWKIPDVSVWGEEGFSIKVTTTGLSKNLSALSGTFTIVRPQQ